jgi:LAS superfamily LD-carboxypeptidase LdcB
MSIDPLDIIAQKESGGRNVLNYKYGPGFSASGHYQIIDETWRRWAKAAGIDISQYPRAIDAPPDVQRAVAAQGYRMEGFRPWEAVKGLVGQEGSFAAPGSGSSGGGAQPMGTLNASTTAPSPAYTNQDLSAYYARKGIDTSGFGGALNKGLYEALGALPPELRGQVTISSGFRTPERQAQLYADAVKKYGSPEAARKWVAPPGRSQHGFGNAADLSFQSDAARQWMHENAAKYGLAFPLGNEAWHVEAAGARAGGQPVNYALGVGGGAAPGGVMTASGEAPEAPIQTANATEAGNQAFNEAFAAQQQSEAAEKAQQAQQAAAAAQQTAQQAQQQRLQPGPGNPSQDSAASLMASLIDKKRIARAGPVPGVLSAWSA